jgi:hypothetical protein
VIAVALLTLASTLAPANAEATVRSMADGRRVETGGDRCVNYWWSTRREFSVGGIALLGFKSQFYNRARISPRVQASYDNGLHWSEYLRLETVELATKGTHGTMGNSGWGPVLVQPHATRKYVLRTVYRVSWARTDVNGNVLRWTVPIVMGENRSRTWIWFSGGAAPVDGCVILSTRNL